MPDHGEPEQIGTQADKWRFRCPYGDDPEDGHSNWDTTNEHFWCWTCSQLHQHNPGVDPEFHEVVDIKTGNRLTRDQIELDVPSFPAHS